MIHTELVHISPASPDVAVLARAEEILWAGGLVAFPTETVYGLGADAANERAVLRAFEAKGRPANNPLIVHVSDEASAQALVADWTHHAQQLANAFWPGPLTMVLRKGPAIPDVVTAGGPTVAIRYPSHPVALALLRTFGAPLAAPSANKSSQVSPTHAQHVMSDLDGRIEMVLDGGPAWGGLESTVIDLTSSPPRILRPGLIEASQIAAVIGPLADSTDTTDDASLRSPGMLPRHYAPRATAVLADDSGWDQVVALCASGVQVGWLPLGHVSGSEHGSLPNLLTMAMPANPKEYASMLYSTLHILDEAGVGSIVIQMPPDTDSWAAVRDRLQRAASTS